ncbi:MAG: hypothetical protein C4547_09750 [Phycisphaerales bacterium]|nr:MAG: hypothetical protein C4547_09750 [Phycisphaerales bacterium]
MPHAILDACCFINLYATGDLRGFLSGTAWTWHIPTAALAESLYIRRPTDADEEHREQINAEPYIDAEFLSVATIDGKDETAAFVRLATELADGEAMALAIASVRGWTVATDDRKARRIAGGLAVPVVTTPELVQRWAKSSRMGRRKLRALLASIQSSARFAPGPNAPGHDWWMAAIRDDVSGA